MEPRDLDLIAKTELFTEISHEETEKLIAKSGAEYCVYKKSSEVFTPKSYKKSLGIILEGRIRVTKNNAGDRAMLMSTLCAGMLFGAAAIFNDEDEYAVSLKCMEKTRLLLIPQESLQDLFSQKPQIAENYIRYLSGRIRFMNKKLYSLSAGTAEQRLAGFLLDNFGEHEAQKLPLSATALANALNLSRASLYRAFDTLISEGSIEKDSKTILIRDKTLLEKYLK